MSISREKFSFIVLVVSLLSAGLVGYLAWQPQLLNRGQLDVVDLSQGARLIFTQPTLITADSDFPFTITQGISVVSAKLVPNSTIYSVRTTTLPAGDWKFEKAKGRIFTIQDSEGTITYYPAFIDNARRALIRMIIILLLGGVIINVVSKKFAK